MYSPLVYTKLYNDPKQPKTSKNELKEDLTQPKMRQRNPKQATASLKETYNEPKTTLN